MNHVFHVMFRNPPEKGEHVKKIQEALEEAGFRVQSEAELKAQQYGKATAQAVFDFKNAQVPKILGPGQKVPDNIVGIQTIQALDRLMAKIEHRRTRPRPVTQEVFNVAVVFEGFAQENQQGQNMDESEEARKFRGELKNPEVRNQVFWRRGVPRSKMGSAQDQVPDVLRRILELHSGNMLGMVCLVGGSAGGPAVLSLGAQLAKAGISLRFVSIADGAFDESEMNMTQDPPVLARGIGFTPTESVNLFQTFGHSIDPGKPKQEVHGRIPGLTDRPMDNSEAVKRVRDSWNSTILKTGGARQKHMNDAHGAVYIEGMNRGRARVRELLGK